MGERGGKKYVLHDTIKTDDGNPVIMLDIRKTREILIEVCQTH